MRKDFLRITGASKTSGGMELLRDFCLTLYERTITVVAGASILETNSLAAVFSGQESFSGGRVYFHDELMNRSGDMRFWAEQVSVITDQDRLIESVSIVDNFFVCIMERQPFFARDRKHRRILEELLDQYGLRIDLDQPVGALHILEQYQLLVLKMFYHSPH